MNIFISVIIIFVLVYLVLNWFASTSSKKIAKFLRYMTIKIPELNDEPSIQAKNKTSKSHDDKPKTGGEVEFTARTPEERASEGEENNVGEKAENPEDADAHPADGEKTPEPEEASEKEG